MAEQTGAITPNAAGAAPTETAIPKGLEKFSAEGKLDAAKLGEGYLELEKKSTQTSQKLSEVERTLAMLSANGLGGGPGDMGRGVDDGRSSGIDDTEPVTRADARPIVQGFLEVMHPEIAYDPAKGSYKNEDFVNGLKQYTAGLPVSIKQAIAAGDFAMTDFAIKQYKALKGIATSQAAAQGGVPGVGVKPNFAEGGSPGGQPAGKAYNRADLRKLMIENPAEYARIADSEVGKAYEEGRVKE